MNGKQHSAAAAVSVNRTAMRFVLLIGILSAYL